MAADITSLSIQVKSDGITQVTSALEKLVTAAEKVEKVIPLASTATNKLSQSNTSAATGIEKLLENFKKQADLVGKNTSESNGYTAALKKATDEQIKMAKASGTVVDNYRNLGAAQKAAIIINNELNASNNKLEAQMRSAAIYDRLLQYKALKLAQTEAIAMNRSLDASEQALANQMRRATIMDRARDYRLLAAAQLEAIAMNKALDASRLREAASTAASTAATRANNAALRDAQALARGLTGSFNSLWLSYGNFAGMAVGLAIGASLKGIVSVGRDVENTLESIRVLGESTTIEISKMRDVIIDLGQGIQGPKDVANALSVLVLAGLNAQQAMAGVADALNLAAVGGVSVEKAASTLVQVSTALGYTAEGFSRIGDVIAKTAAVSMSSVDSISGAFKSAAAVGELYGASLTDIGVGLAAISNLGIQGTAAGTSLKNFYKDLTDGSDKTTEALKKMGLSVASFKGSDGFVLPLLDVIKKLDEGLSKVDRQDSLGKIFKERGVKEGAALIALLHTISTEVDEFGNVYANKAEEIADRINKSYAFSALGAIAMAQTTDSQLKSVVNTLQTQFLVAFQSVSPQINEVARALKVAFNSEEFVTGIKNAALFVAQLTKFIVDHTEVILTLAKAYLVFKAIRIAVVLTEIALAFDVAALSAKLFSVALGPIGIAIAVLTTGWVLYTDAKNKATDNKAAVNNLTEQVDAIEKEAKRQQDLLEGKKRGISELDLLKEQERKKDKEARAKGLEEARDANAAIEKELELQISLLSVAERKVLAKKTDPNAPALTNQMLSTPGVDSVMAAQKELAVQKEIVAVLVRRSEAANIVLMTAAKGNAEYDDNLAKENRRKETVLNAEAAIEEGRAMGLTALNTYIKKVEENFEIEKRVVDNRIALVDYMNKSGLLSDSEAANAKELLLNKAVADQKNAFQKELDALDRFKSEDSKRREEIAGKRADIERRFGKLQEDEAFRLQKILLEPSTAAAQFEKKQQDEADKTIESINKQTEALRAKNIAYASIPASVRAMGLTEKQMADEVTQVNIDQLQARLNGFLSLDAAGQDLHQKEMNRITDEINARSKFMGEQQATEARVAANKAILDYNVQWKAANTKIGDDLASAIIDGGGSGFKKLIKDMKLAFAKLILQPILAPISGAFASATTGNGLGGVLGQATGATGVTGGVSGLAGLASSANSAYNAISSGFSGIGTSVTNAVQSAMNFAGVPNAAASAGAFGPTAAGGNIATSGAANAAGTAAGYAAGAVAGKMIGSAISGEFGKSSVVNVATIIGTVLGAGSPLGGIIGGAVGGLLNRAFGMGNKNVSSAGITGTASEVAVTGNTFSNWAQKGGFFRSDKSGTDTAALSAEVINTFKSTLVTLKGVSVDFAKNIDVGSGALVNYSKEFKLVLGSDAAANQKTITDFFTSMGDDMATKLVPNIANFAFVSERASETLQRLSLVFSATNNLAGVLGKTVEQTFGSIGLASYDARQRLIELAGSLANLNTQVTFYATNFLTEADKIIPVQAAVTAALAAMGLQAMTTTEQFSNVVKGLDLTTKAGAEQFSVLMALAPAFKQVADYIKESLVKMIKDATDKLDTLKKDASDSFTVMSTLLTAQKAAGLALKDNANSAFEIVKGILELQKSSALELQSSLQATVASISKTPDSVMSRAAAQNQISNALDAAKSTGVLPTAASLSDALRVVSTPNSSLFATYVDFARDAGITAGKVSELSNLTAKSISNIEKQLSLAQIQVDLLNGVKVNTTDLITAMEEFSRATVVAQEGLIKANEIAKQLEFAQSQLDSLNDIKTKLSSMPSDQAIALDKQISFAQAQLDSLNGNKSSIILASLSQVNAIDKQIAVSQGQLEALNNSRNSILSTSSSQIASIERQINVSQGQLDTLKETKALSMNMPADQVAAIDKQISFAQAQLDSLNSNKSLLMFSTANQIAGVDSQISFAQAQLDSLNSSKSLTLSLASSQVAAIDKQISFAQAQLNALNDIKTLTFGVQSAIRDFNTSLQAALVQKEVLAAVVAQATTTAVVAQAAIATVVEKVSPSMPVTYVPPVVATPPVVKYVPPVYVGTGTRSDFETDAYGNVLANYEDRFKSPGFDINGNALDGSHAIGLDNVPFDGYNAKLHKGEMVLPASSAQAVRSDASIAEIVLAVKESMQANSAENQSMASNLQILRKLFQQAMPGGNSLQTTTYVP
jgi:TP901 family phage tail tape measure protein